MSTRWMGFRLVWILAVSTLLLGTATAQVSLRFQTWHLGEEPWGTVLHQMKAAFEQTNPDVSIVFDRVTYGDKEMIFTTQSEARAAADIAHFSYRPIQQFVERGYLLDLTPLVEAEGPGFLDAFLPQVVSLGVVDGRIYALPDHFDPMVLIYNADLFRQAGLDPDSPPTDWDEFVEYAKALTRDTNGDGRVDQWGFAMIGMRQEGLFMRFNPWFWGAGAEYLSADNSQSALDSPEALEGFRFYIELATVHEVVPPGPAETGAQYARVLMANGQVAMMVGFAPDPNIMQNLNPNINVREVFRMAPVPEGRIRATSAWVSNRVISATTPNPEEAWRLYRYIHEAENQLHWFTGAGVLSSREDVRFSDEVMNDSFSAIMAEQAPFVKFEPLVPEWPEIADLVITAIQEALTRTKPIEVALSDAHNAVNEILGRR